MKIGEYYYFKFNDSIYRYKGINGNKYINLQYYDDGKWGDARGSLNPLKDIPITNKIDLLNEL